ncbi:hypothetical protein AACH06_17965 [Ideonella sp. DXS29W]|uniref:DUF962 domain-containing protein n=1 Tax=Ideonella lacteola TaxID=2984193 RepID=A0ABU9BRW3_9BURK
MNAFLKELAIQRWDDHRYYHHSRINQSLHLVSAISFLVAYGLVFIDPAWAALLAWGVSMTTRQAGHFFFEPRGYDEVNQATDDYKEAIKVGYNIRRKIVLMGVWVSLPVLLWWQPSLFGLIEPAVGWEAYAHDVGMAWFFLGVTGLLFRVAQLAWQQSLAKGLVWMSKILTDPFHDIWLYHKAPWHLLRGEWIDPMHHVHAESDAPVAEVQPR